MAFTSGRRRDRCDRLDYVKCYPLRRLKGGGDDEDGRTIRAARKDLGVDRVAQAVTYTIQSIVFEIRRYRTATGDEPLTQWLADLRDRQARARILVRLERLGVGNFGDCKFLRDGVSELRIDWGPGYRVYYGRDGRTLVVLLCGGDKRKQDADIRKAVELWQEYGNRKKRDPGARI